MSSGFFKYKTARACLPPRRRALCCGQNRNKAKRPGITGRHGGVRSPITRVVSFKSALQKVRAAPPAALHAVGRSCPNLAAAAAQFPCRLLIFSGSGGSPAPKSAAAFPRVHKRCETHSVCVCPFYLFPPAPPHESFMSPGGSLRLCV